ncbi:hypothetical protein [Chryseobacterium sp. c4a]|uniref:hypothetical protein n=1 Tax=Chryseobacterium sp. c4a TaxID=1573582 RepID=UPI0013567B90|nr:hypothetical protein [Chryseobacterium sp. c4a]
MRVSYFFIIAFLFSCSKSIEDKCFVDKMNAENVVMVNKTFQPYTLKQILAEKPKYLEINNLTAYRDFVTDRAEFLKQPENSQKEGETSGNNFTILNERFSNQFLCFAQQQVGNIIYGLGFNKLGYWLLKIENNKTFAYFLGLSPNQYYVNRTQQNLFVLGGYLQVKGSLVSPRKSKDPSNYKDYSVIEDGKLFTIKLKDLMLDSDQDGYNDIFENSFGLNPNRKDTDGDGINDFEDMNPMFTSSKGKFTRLYESLLPNPSIDSEKRNFEFQVYKSDCDYFHQINPVQKVLFIPEDKNKQTYYTSVSDIIDEVISPIQKNEKNPDSFYIYKVGSYFKNDYSADYENENWVLKVIGGYII